MKHRLRYFSIAVRNGLPRIPWLAIAIVLPVFAMWVVGLFLLPRPRDDLVHYLSLAVVVGAFVVMGWFHVAADLRTTYPPAVLFGMSVCLLVSGYCLVREFSLGLLLRLSLPLMLLAVVAYYMFYFSIYRGRQRVSKLQIGDRFPDFALPNSQGDTITLSSILAKGPALLTFYKGDW